MVWPREFRGTEATSHKQEKNSVGKRGKTIIWRGKTIFWRGPGVVPAWSPPPRICGACRGKKHRVWDFYILLIALIHQTPVVPGWRSTQSMHDRLESCGVSCSHLCLMVAAV